MSLKLKVKLKKQTEKQVLLFLNCELKLKKLIIIK